MRDITATKELLKGGVSKEDIRKWDLGLCLHKEFSHHRLIEEREDHIKITHYQGDRIWVTYEDKPSNLRQLSKEGIIRMWSFRFHEDEWLGAKLRAKTQHQKFLDWLKNF